MTDQTKQREQLSVSDAQAAIATCDERMMKVQGVPSSGKTEALVQRCAQLVKNGVPARDILVSASSSFAQADFELRLARAFSEQGIEGAKSMRVLTPLRICADVLEKPEAQAATGRRPRLLTGAEYKFFLEDMRTLGQPARRLRGMLSFFYRQWAHLAPRSEWLVGGEEEILFDHMVETLSAYGAMLEQEAPYLCAEFLKSDAGASSRKAYRYLLADDFQDCSHAEQVCLCLLAGEQIVVAGNVRGTVERPGAHPFPEGFANFEATRRNVRVFALDKTFGEDGINALVRAIGAYDPSSRQAGGTCGDAENAEEASPKQAVRPKDTDPFATGCSVVKWNTPEDEMDGATKWLRALVDRKPGESACVVVPNKQWARTVERVLAKRGFSVSAAGAQGGIGGDPRTSERARALAAYTLLNLIADPSDMAAWRCWCGIGNYLTNSDAWDGLMKYAHEQGESLAEALERASRMRRAGEPEPFLRAYALVERWDEGHDLIRKHAPRKGFALLRAVGAEDLPEFEGVAQTIAGDEGAAELFALVKRCVSEPSFAHVAKGNALHIATYRTVAGLKYDNVLVLGCIDGFMPQRSAFEVVSTEEERAAVTTAERRAFLRTAAAAGKRLMIGYFTKAPLEIAERTKMQVARVRSENDVRMALVRPSAFLAETEAARPSTTGGQALLSEAGL